MAQLDYSFLIGAYSFYINDINYLWTIAIFIILIPSGAWDYWIFISIWTGFILFGQIKSIDSTYYWLNVCVAFTVFNLSKMTRIIVGQKLSLHIKSNLLLFFKCYVYEIIDTYSKNGNLEIEKIQMNNNELSRQNTAANMRFGVMSAD